MSKFRLGNTKASRLTPTSVMDIREKWATGMYTQAQLSRMHQVSITTIRNVIYGVTWQRLPAAIPDEQVSFEAQQSQRNLQNAEIVPIPDDVQAKLMRELADIESPKGETQSVDPIDAYLKRSKEEGSK